MSSKVPADLKYAKSHEWVRLNGNIATVGISDHAQHELTDVVFVEVPAVGRKAKAGEAVAVVESVKAASDLYSPVSGRITAVNDKLDEVFDFHGVPVVVDKRSLMYLGDATVDFHDDLNRRGFSITNPSAKSTCGCGSSFSM